MSMGMSFKYCNAAIILFFLSNLLRILLGFQIYIIVMRWTFFWCFTCISSELPWAGFVCFFVALQIRTAFYNWFYVLHSMHATVQQSLDSIILFSRRRSNWGQNRIGNTWLRESDAFVPMKLGCVKKPELISRRILACVAHFRQFKVFSYRWDIRSISFAWAE